MGALLSAIYVIPVCAIPIFLIFITTKFVSLDEQIFIKNLTSEVVVDGPKAVFVNPFLTKSHEIKKALSLGPMEYCVVKSILSGEKRVEAGPKLVFLRSYDKIVRDETGNQKRQSICLKSNEYIRFHDLKTGKVRVVRGEKGCVVPGPDETHNGLNRAIDLKIFEYIKIEDKLTGAVRTERGEALVFLGPYEEQMGTKRCAIEVDEETAVLVRNKRTGQPHLVTKKILFVPSDDEEVMEVRKLIKLAEHEACIVRDKVGKDIFHFGTNESQRSFFLPPHSELVQLLWSRGRRRERRDLRITKLDLRPVFMSFEFNCRTNDNVELILEGSFFWEVVDLSSMVKFTNDTTGDICNHARSRFIELVSKVTLQDFMTQFNMIAKQVHENDHSDFYVKRGVKIHSLEVTGFRCAEQSTALILEQIIQETTNRMNRLQMQESQNEVQLREIRGDIEEERVRSELIDIQTSNSNAKSKMEGLAEPEKVKTFIEELSTGFPDMDMDVKINLWNTLRKKDALEAVSGGNASLYFTPNDVNLSIEQHQHVKK